MARRGDTEFIPDPKFFETALRLPGVERLTDEAAGRALARAKADAPVDTAEYRNGLHIEHRESRYRRVALVSGSDPKTLLVEARTGNLARSLKAAKQ